MRFLFASWGFVEGDLCRRISLELRRHGHEVVQITYNRRSADAMRESGFDAHYLPDLMDWDEKIDVDAEAARIASQYEASSVREVYITDPPSREWEEDYNVERTVRQFRAFEKVFDEFKPDVVVPEVGRATMFMVAHFVGLARGATVLWTFHSIFPKRLRVSANAYHAPMVPQDEVRELSADERAEVERFVDDFTRAGKPVLKHRRVTVTPKKLRTLMHHFANYFFYDRGNDYLRPIRWTLMPLLITARRALSRLLYQKLRPERPFVYFPIHLADDFKIERVIPHCLDQESLIRQVARALPQGYDLVLKEHPLSVGGNPVRMLRRLSRIPNVRLVNPFTSSHDLIKRASAITVISSTVGIEALLYGKPVLTMGQPYYSGYGVTLDVDSFREIREAVPAVLHFRPDRERILQMLHAGMRSTYDAHPGSLDLSDENAAKTAEALLAFMESYSEDATKVAA